MRAFLKKYGFRRIVAGLCAAAVLCSVMPQSVVQAASKSDGTATLRIISTTDMHGQIGTMNYDTASRHQKGSLAQVYTLIKEARKSLKYGNTLTVDIGDTIYGYSSDHIKSGEIDHTEYMYQAMSKMGYDAMTLGNHEFDYGYEYVKEALKENGLDKKMVVSNVFDAKTRKNIWAENMVLTKSLNTTTGKKFNVKIGIIGVTIPVLSAQFDHTGLLETDDMTDAVRDQVEKLKSKKVDLIIVLAHTGIGKESDEELGKSAGYALTLIDGVDAVIGGHSHVNFPSKDDAVLGYYDYEGVSEDGLINGKIYTSVEDHAAGIAIADMKLKFTNGRVGIVSEKAKIKKVTDDVEADKTIVKIANSFEKEIKPLYDKTISATDKTIDNYFGTIEDNAAMQAINEAKIQYGLRYAKKADTKYTSCPVIAASAYQLVGKTSGDDYIHINDRITVGDSLNIQNWDRAYSYVYYITGAQLREWMEYRAASAYQSVQDKIDKKWNDKKMYELLSEGDRVPALSEKWLDNWDNYMVFDGVEYEIDPTQPARYNIKGDLVDASAHRISKLTCNGKEVTDSTTFVLVTSPIQSNYPILGKTVYKQKLDNEKIYNNTLLCDYIKQQSENEKFIVDADDNWQVNFPEGTNFVVKSSADARAVAESKPWYAQTLYATDEYAYFQADFGYEKKDTNGPTLVVSQLDLQKTSHPIRIAVQANDKSAVASVKYAKGLLDKKSGMWASASNVSDGMVLVSDNGVYSFLATDQKGNTSIRYVNVTNYDKQALEKPVVEKYTNRNKAITGTAEPGTTLKIKAAGETYSTTVSADGTFKYELPLQKSGTTVKLWVEKETAKSETTKLTVERTGPNYPDIDDITNKTKGISGYVNDSEKYCKIVAIVDKTVYVPKNGGLNLFYASELNEEDYVIKEVDYTVSDGYFELDTPVYLGGTKIKVYSLDWIARRSVVGNYVAETVAPNLPVPYEVYAVDDYVYGKIPKPLKNSCTVKVNDGTNVYESTADAKGFFAVQVGELAEGQKLIVTASDVVDGVTRVSAKAQLVVASYKNGLTEGTDISFAPITNKDTELKGHMEDYSGKINLLIGSKRVIVQTDENGDFSYKLEKPKSAGTSIVAMVRDSDGTVYDMNETTVELAVPEAPELIDEVVYDTTTELQLFCTDRATAVVKVGKKYYKVSKAVFDEEMGGYIYSVTLKKPAEADSKIIYFMMNDAGKSDKKKVVVEADPEKPVEEENTTTEK